MASDDDRNLLIAALESAWLAYQRQSPRPTILSGPTESILGELSEAIASCTSFKEVAGHMLYSGGSGPVIAPSLFAIHIFRKAEKDEGKGISEAADWLLRLLATRRTTGVFKAAIWGASIDREIRLHDGSRIMPFAAVSDTHMKRRILERATTCYDGSAWLAHNYFDAPRLVLEKEVPDFPYIGIDGAAFQKISDLQFEARDLWLFVEAALVGHPLAVGCWFEYADQELDINGWQNSLAWLLPEVPPRVASFTPVGGATVQDRIQRFDALPGELQSRLLRSMERFTLSQCRSKLVDRILDLELAFEIAVSGPGRDFAPMGWKVSVRSAQLIGGELNVRQTNRDLINDLFRLRSAATHGSDLSRRDEREIDATVRRGLTAYQQLLDSFLALGRLPDWSALELEPRT